MIAKDATTMLKVPGLPLLTGGEPLMVEAAVVGVGVFLFQWLAGHALDNRTGIRGTVDTRQLRAELRKLAQSHQEHAAMLERLQAQLERHADAGRGRAITP